MEAVRGISFGSGPVSVRYCVLVTLSGRYGALALAEVSWMRREVSREDSLEAECQEAGREEEVPGPRELTREPRLCCRQWRTMETRARPTKM